MRSRSRLTIPRVQVLVHMRVHATPAAQQHAKLTATLSLAGAGVIVGSSIDHEIAALSFNALQATLELRASDLTLAGSLQAVQLDDQSLDASQPVVLGPAGVVTKGAHFFYILFLVVVVVFFFFFFGVIDSGSGHL